MKQEILFYHGFVEVTKDGIQVNINGLEPHKVIIAILNTKTRIDDSAMLEITGAWVNIQQWKALYKIKATRKANIIT